MARRMAVVYLLLSAAMMMSIATATTPAPAPPPASNNITQVLASQGSLKTFVSLVTTIVKDKWQPWVNAANTTGLTILAPIDSAFTPQILSAAGNLSAESLTALLLYHSIPTFLTSKHLTSSSVVKTYAGFSLNISNINGVVTFKTALNSANATSNYYNEFPLSVFTINQVLLPAEIFTPSRSPSPSPSPSSRSPSPSPRSPSPSPRSPSPSPRSPSPSPRSPSPSPRSPSPSARSPSPSPSPSARSPSPPPSPSSRSPSPPPSPSSRSPSPPPSPSARSPSPSPSPSSRSPSPSPSKSAAPPT